MFEVNYRREKNNKRSAAPFMSLLVSRFLSFICISYPLRFFKFYTGILHDSKNLEQTPWLKTWSRLPRSIAFICLILFFMFACNNFPFRVFVTMIYWTSTEVLLSLVTPLDSVVPYLDFEPITVSKLSVLISLVQYLIRSVSAEVSLNYISRIQLMCSFFWPCEDQYMVHGFDFISTAHFRAMICFVSAEGSLNRAAHSIEMFLLLTLSKSLLFILWACLSLSSR